MKRILCVALVAGALTVLWTAPSLALIHFGARIGLDHTTWDAHEVAGFTLGSGTATVTREAIDAPLLLGVSAGTGLLPILDLEIAAEAAIKKYNFTYDPSVGSTVSEEVSYSRVSLMATLKRDLMSFPPVTPVVRVYAGGGLGFHYVTPIMNKNLIVDEVGDVTEPLDTDALIDRDLEVGIHGLGGLKLKLPVLPFGITAEARYLVKSDENYEKPGPHWSFYGGAELGF
jgi:hypothetical protein